MNFPSICGGQPPELGQKTLACWGSLTSGVPQEGQIEGNTSGELDMAISDLSSAFPLMLQLAAKEKEAKESAERIVADAKEKADAESRKIIETAKDEITAMVEEATRKVVQDETVSGAFDTFLDDAEIVDMDMYGD